MSEENDLLVHCTSISNTSALNVQPPGISEEELHVDHCHEQEVTGSATATPRHMGSTTSTPPRHTGRDITGGRFEPFTEDNFLLHSSDYRNSDKHISVLNPDVCHYEDEYTSLLPSSGKAANKLEHSRTFQSITENSTINEDIISPSLPSLSDTDSMVALLPVKEEQDV